MHCVSFLTDRGDEGFQSLILSTQQAFKTEGKNTLTHTLGCQCSPPPPPQQKQQQENPETLAATNLSPPTNTRCFNNLTFTIHIFNCCCLVIEGFAQIGGLIQFSLTWRLHLPQLIYHFLLILTFSLNLLLQFFSVALVDFSNHP